MAKGDWAPGTRLQPGIVNIEAAEDGHLRHVGVGYHVVAPSGRVVHSGGFTWHSPDGDYAQAPAEHVRALTRSVAALLAAAAEAEGVEPPTGLETPTS